MTNNLKIIFLPGNGGGDTREGFFPYLKEKFEEKGVTVISPGIYPDPIIGRESVWIPYIESLGADENTILIGHSTGAIAAMKYAENHRIKGSVLVATYHSDLGIQSEKDAEYFDAPWNWDMIKKNQEFIIQFFSIDDPHIPVAESRFVHEQLGSDYHELDGQGHFYPQDTFPELIEALGKYIN